MIDPIARGERARQILDDEVFIEAFATVERDAIEAMIALPPGSGDLLIEYTARIRAVRDARQAIHSVMLTGKDTATRANRDRTFA